MKENTQFFKLFKLVLHFTVTSLLFYFYFLAVVKSLTFLNPESSLLILILFCGLIIGIAKFIVIDFIVGTILSGLFNIYDFLELKIISIITYITCCLSAFIIAEQKRLFFLNYSNKEIVFLTYFIVFLLTLYLINQAKIATQDLKVNKAFSKANQLLEMINSKDNILTYGHALNYISNDLTLKNEEKKVISNLLLANFNKLSEEEKENDKELSELYNTINSQQ